MGTQKSHGWNNNKRSYTAVLHRYMESKEMPSRSDRGTNNHSIEMRNHLSSRPAHGNISPETTSSFTDKGSLNYKEYPNLPGIPVPLKSGLEVAGNSETQAPKKMKTKVFNFLEGHKTFSSRVYHHFM